MRRASTACVRLEKAGRLTGVHGNIDGMGIYYVVPNLFLEYMESMKVWTFICVYDMYIYIVCMYVCMYVLYCIVLYCIVLYCIVLYCTVLYCIVLYCIVLYCIVLYCIVLYCMCIYIYINGM